MKVQGRVWKYGDNVNTDVIFPGKYTYTVTDPAEIARHALEDLDPAFAQRAQPGDVVVAGRNWGCGSSREQAATALKLLGVGAVVAESFARIYYRNAINSGLPVIICPEAVAALNTGDAVTVDLDAGVIHTPAGDFTFPRLPESVQGIVDAGGLVPYLRRKLGTEGRADLPELPKSAGGE